MKMKTAIKLPRIMVVFSLILIGSLLFPIVTNAFQNASTQPGRFGYISYIADQFDCQQAYSTIAELTKDEYEGRLTGSEGGKKAAAWIAEQFDSFTLQPYKEGSYYQAVTNSLSLSTGDNVIGFIPSSDRTCQQSIIIGAHYDHLGKSFSGQIYRGANDNASGTSVVMEIARVLSKTILLSSVHIIFIAFTGEEQGLYGSKQYSNEPLYPLNHALAMFNLDMVGTGTGSWEMGTNFNKQEPSRQVLKEALRIKKLKIKEADWMMKPVSDHYPFYQKGIPVMCLLKENPTNLGGYHNFKDTIESIDPKNLNECGSFCLLTILSLLHDYLVIPNLEKEQAAFLRCVYMDVCFKKEEILKLFKSRYVISS